MTDVGDAPRFYALCTFRGDGTSVMTPVWAAFQGDTGYVLTGARTFKVRRLARSPRVEIAPSDYRGAVSGEWRSGAATVADETAHRRGIVLLRRKYGLQFRIFHVVSALGARRRTVGRAITLRIELDAAAPDDAGVARDEQDDEGQVPGVSR